MGVGLGKETGGDGLAGHGCGEEDEDDGHHGDENGTGGGELNNGGDDEEDDAERGCLGGGVDTREGVRHSKQADGGDEKTNAAEEGEGIDDHDLGR
jgi:hypothetical protein